MAMPQTSCDGVQALSQAEPRGNAAVSGTAAFSETQSDGVYQDWQGIVCSNPSSASCGEFMQVTGHSISRLELEADPSGGCDTPHTGRPVGFASVDAAMLPREAEQTLNLRR